MNNGKMVIYCSLSNLSDQQKVDTISLQTSKKVLNIHSTEKS